jgi:hypothetical protein
MDNPTYEPITAAVYEPPVLVEIGEFNTDTLGLIQPHFDSHQGRH